MDTSIQQWMRTRMLMMNGVRVVVLSSLALLMGTLPGCGKSDSIDRVVMEGQVTFEGLPVPFGSIWFEPTDSVGAVAPTGFAVIRDGHFKTAQDKSPVGGAYTVRLSGYSQDITEFEGNEADGLGIVKTLFQDYTLSKEIESSNEPWVLTVPKQ